MSNLADYLVAGAGSAGAVVAARLSEDSSKKIILFEAGGEDNRLFVRMPAVSN
jgi:choline dehydrogenase